MNAFTSAATNIILLPNFVPTNAASDKSGYTGGIESISKGATKHAHTTHLYSTASRATTYPRSVGSARYDSSSCSDSGMCRPYTPAASGTTIRSLLSMSSIAPADVFDSASAKASEGSIAGADDEYEYEDENADKLTSPVAFFSSLLRFRNGEVDLRAAPVEEDEEDEGAGRRDGCFASNATRSLMRHFPSCHQAAPPVIQTQHFHFFLNGQPATKAYSSRSMGKG